MRQFFAEGAMTKLEAIVAELDDAQDCNGNIAASEAIAIVTKHVQNVSHRTVLDGHVVVAAVQVHLNVRAHWPLW